MTHNNCPRYRSVPSTLHAVVCSAFAFALCRTCYSLKRIPNGVWSYGGSRFDSLSATAGVALFGIVLLVQVSAHHANASSGPIDRVNPSEKAAVDRWVTTRLQEVPKQTKPEPSLNIVANYDFAQCNGRYDKPLNFSGKLHKRGIYCHAPSKILVRLPGPGKSLSAVVGVDSNNQTRPGRGSVVFSVKVAGKEACRSKVMREGMAGEPLSVDLGGAAKFYLEVDNAGDGISCDQADWVDAKVVLADGKTVWLGDLPLIDLQKVEKVGPPFSFVYDGKPSGELLKTWKRELDTKKLDQNRTEFTLRYTDPKTGLAVTCVAIRHHDFPTVDWTVYLKNTGTADTPIIERVQAIDDWFERDARGEFLLHHCAGAVSTELDYSPRETQLGLNASKRFAPVGGRSTNSAWPYFNLQYGGGGTIIAVGWPGQWAADFARNESQGLHVTAGQELTRFKLLPGEEVRTPRVVLQFWRDRDWIDSQNVWRRWMAAHNMPKPGGKLPPPQLLGCSSRLYTEMTKADEASQKMCIDRYLAEGIKLDYWWMDAGWYPCEGNWPKVGTWEVDRKRFPKGLRAVSDHAAEKGIKTVVWFEPERVHAGTWLHDKRPQWLLGGNNLNLGNPEAQKWLTDHIDKLITNEGIGLYRQDFNMEPLAGWRKNDAPDRQGITENKYIVGLLAYWDELIKRHPDLLFDECASGGRRNDLECMKRAVPMWRTDHSLKTTSNQAMTHGISLWLPFYGTGTIASEMTVHFYDSEPSKVIVPYCFWSDVTPSLVCLFDVRVKDIDYDALRRLIEGWRKINKYYYGDYYPLTPYSLDDTAWIGWQFNDLEKEGGMIQMFRRPKSVYESGRFKLRGLEAEAKYVLTELNSNLSVSMTGRELAENGLLITIDKCPAAAVYVYKKAK
jgi:alpha-galactosidase